MRFSRRCVAVVLLSLVTSSAVHAADEVDALINQLADPEPAVRERATAELRKRGAGAKRALLKAADSPRAAIAEAAQALLVNIPWGEPGDPPAAKLALDSYGRKSPADRAKELLRLLGAKPAEANRPVVLRVLRDETNDEVAWKVLPQVDITPDWQPAVARIDDATASPALLLFKSRFFTETGDERTAFQLADAAIAREIAEPAAPIETLQQYVLALTNDDRRAGRYAKAADRIRGVLRRSEDRSAMPEGPLTEALLDLQTRFGPLPGYQAELTRSPASATVRMQQSVALAVVSSRIGSVAGTLLLDRAIGDREDESELQRTERLLLAGSFLSRTGQRDLALGVLERASEVTDADAIAAGGRVDLRLYDLYNQQKNHLKAAQHLERAVQRFGGNVSLTLVKANGKTEAWPMEEVRAAIHFNYFKHAEQQKDKAAMEEQVRLIMATNTVDGSVFLDIFPTLEQIGSQADVDAYFDRVYAAAKAKVDESPNDPLYSNDLAWFCARAGRRLEEAVQLAEHAVKLKPDEAAYLDTLAEAKFRVGAIQEAIALEEKALKSRPDDTFMQEQLERFKKAATTRPAQ